ncbi:MAG TPA: GreA/GreB family elongation factor [Candidatus Saccharimonadales bacterium]|nr:GreA/GreB family elongation factor [Candidatus Saccharimonadales bacterium]
MTPKHHRITPDGIAELQQHLQGLRQARKAAAQELRDLISQSSAGNVLEDSMRSLHQDRAMNLDIQISNIEHILSTAEVLRKPASKAQAQLGSQVTIDLGGKKRVYTIVGSIEANPERGKVSDESPLGQSLLGKKVNDCFVLGRRGIGATVIAIE